MTRHGFEIDGQVRMRRSAPAWMLGLLVSGAGCGVVLEPIEDGESTGGGEVEGGASPINAGGNCESGGAPQGGDTPGAGGWSEGGGGPAGGSSPDCYDESAALYLRPGNFSGVETHQGACSASQISEMYSACVDVALPGDCEVWEEAAPENETCFQCTLAPVGPPAPFPVLLGGDGALSLSIFACIAHVLGFPECEVPNQSLVTCAYTACGQCDIDSGEHNDCVNWAINESPVCSQIELPAGCESLFEVQAAPAECIGDAITFEEAFPILANFYCGP